MDALLRRLRGALGMGLTWAVAWSMTGILIGVLSSLGLPLDWFMRVFDAPLPALAVPGFVSGTIFSGVLGIAARRRRFDELSLPGFAAWGALGGALLTMIPFAGTGGTIPLGVIGIAAGVLTTLSAASACATLVLARKAEDQALLSASDEVAEVGLTDREARELLG